MERIICTTVLVNENGNYCDPKCPRLWEGKTCLTPTRPNTGIKLNYDWDYHSENECEMGTCLIRTKECIDNELPPDIIKYLLSKLNVDIFEIDFDLENAAQKHLKRLLKT